jgi:hypothetical protein
LRKKKFKFDEPELEDFDFDNELGEELVKEKDVPEYDLEEEAEESKGVKLEAIRYIPKKVTDKKNFVIRFTNEETREILENVIRRGKNDQKIYSLVLIWLTSFFKKPQFKILRNLSGGNIYVHDFNDNTEELKTIVQDILYNFVKTGENKKGKTGLKHKIDWECRDNQIITFVFRFVHYNLFQAMSRVFRQSKASNNLFNERKKPNMQRISEIAKRLSDPSLTAVESINELKRYDVSDEELYTYRQLFTMGDYDNFCSLNDDLLNRVECSDLNITKQEAIKEDTDKKETYEILVNTLNCKEMEKVHRDFLKCYYEIPYTTSIGDEKYEFTQNLTDFLKYYPSYIPKFCEIKQKKSSYVKTNTKIPLKKIIMERVNGSEVYIKSHNALKKILEVQMEKKSIDID